MSELPRQRDNLTIGRLMVLTAGVAVGLTLFAPSAAELRSFDTDALRTLSTAVMLGLSLPGILFSLGLRRTGQRLQTGGLIWLTMSLGILLLMPSVVANRMLEGDNANGSQAGVCLMYTLPLLGLWFGLAALLGGALRERRWREQPWAERTGIYLAFAWWPLGIWVLCEFYWNDFLQRLWNG